MTKLSLSLSNKAKVDSRAVWAKKPIKDLLEVIIDYRDKTPPKSPFGIPTLTAANVKKGRIDLSSVSYVSQETYNRWITRGLPKPGDVLITTEAPVGEVASFPGDQTYLITRRVMALRGKADKLDNDFLKYSLLYSGNHDRLLSVARGSTVSRVLKTDITGLEIVVPPLPEQKAIAQILGTLDDKIELNQQMNETLEAMARAMFKSWFVDFDPVRAKMEGRQPAGMDAATADLFPDEFEESSLGLIPKGWRVGTIDECTSLIIDYRGKTPKKLGGDWSDSGIPAISAKNVKSGKMLNTENIKYVDNTLFKKWMKEPLAIGDIIMTSEAPLGELYYLASNANYCLSQRLYGIRANQKNCKSIYLYHALASDNLQSQLESRATGTTVTGIRQTELRKVQILLPRLDVQEKIAINLENFIQKIHLNYKENQTLATIRDALLPKLMSGQIRVNEAEKLLEAVA